MVRFPPCAAPLCVPPQAWRQSSTQRALHARLYNRRVSAASARRGRWLIARLDGLGGPVDFASVVFKKKAVLGIKPKLGCEEVGGHGRHVRLQNNLDGVESDT